MYQLALLLHVSLPPTSRVNMASTTHSCRRSNSTGSTRTGFLVGTPEHLSNWFGGRPFRTRFCAPQGNLHLTCKTQRGYARVYASARGDPVPYASGEVPVPGDYVKNQWEQPGTVIRVSVASNGEESVTVRWDDGGVDSPLTQATEFILISRQA